MHHDQKVLKEKADIASRYLYACGFSSTQVNGQRIAINQLIEPPRGLTCETEVFVGKLPRDLFEDELLPVMKRAGPVYKIRLMMDFSGSNRGFAYVQYAVQLGARNAVLSMNPVQFRPKSPPSGVQPSFDNRRLFFRGIPAGIDERDILSNLREICEDVIAVEMLDPMSMDPMYKRNAIITFSSHEAATHARRLLIPGDLKIGGEKIIVDWAKPEARQKIEPQRLYYPLPAWV